VRGPIRRGGSAVCAASFLALAVAGCGDDRPCSQVVATDARTGTQRWVHEIRGRPGSVKVTATRDGRLVGVSVERRNTDEIVLIDGADGSVRQTLRGALGDANENALSADNQVWSSRGELLGSAGWTTRAGNGVFFLVELGAKVSDPDRFTAIDERGRRIGGTFSGIPYAGNRGGGIAEVGKNLVEYDLATGEVRWRLPKTVDTRPAAILVSPRYVAIRQRESSDTEPVFEVVDRGTGAVRRITGSSVSFVGDGLLVRGSTSRLIDLATGRIRWQSRSLSRFGLTRETTALSIRENLSGFDARTGKRLWNVREPGVDVFDVSASGVLVYEVRNASALIGRDLATGARLWRFKDRAFTGTAVVGGKNLITHRSSCSAD
jgi:outer membrane protein assembly factor BamB